MGPHLVSGSREEGKNEEVVLQMCHKHNHTSSTRQDHYARPKIIEIFKIILNPFVAHTQNKQVNKIKTKTKQKTDVTFQV